MKRSRPVCWLALLALIGGVGVTHGFEVEEYRSFLEQHADMSAAELEAMYPAGVFERYAPADFAAAAYSDSVDFHLRLTQGEKELIGRHGFVVTERIRPPSFGAGFLDIYHMDLPVFVSTDAILHALHMSYDAILIDLERWLLRPRLERMLEALHGRLRELAQLADPVEGMEAVWEDVDLYLTVPRRLLGQEVEPVFAGNRERVQTLLVRIAGRRAAEVSIFGAARQVDFSQFTPRGHYTDFPELTEYFQAMIWLGRIELYLSPPGGTVPVLMETARHQGAMAATLAELAEVSEAEQILEEIDRTLQALVGEQDNATLPQLRQALAAAGIGGAVELLGEAGWTRFQQALAEQGTGSQRILSQLLLGDPFATEQLEPARAFLLLGQRFVVDSHVTGNVVYDRIRYGGEKMFRGLPSTLDVLFALGNDAVLPLLEGELEQYRYATNLAGLRYLVDGFDGAFWQGTFYSGWLSAIRALNPPGERDGLPAFMRTGAWWQEKLNTQLAAWAQLRHDNLLYAKQSYTGGIVCSYPEGYVEPIPEFYRAVQELAEGATGRLGGLLGENDSRRERIDGYFREMAAIADTLEGIARKELDGEELSAGERLFLQTVLYDEPLGCAPVYRGWYARLYYTGEGGFFKEDLVVADVHTQPTDAAGSMVGKVLHAGTGPVNMAVVVADACIGEADVCVGEAGTKNGTPTAFAGPVMSYYEHVSLNFERLTDEEWYLVHAQELSFRPDFVRSYLADGEGLRQAPESALPTAVEGEAADRLPEESGLSLWPGYPNPFNASTLIRFSVGPEVDGERVVLTVYGAGGQVVRRLVDRALPAGNYSARWDGTADGGEPAASGVYTYLLRAGDRQLSGRVSLVK